MSTPFEFRTPSRLHLITSTARAAGHRSVAPDEREPTDEELAAIQREEPLIDAEIALVNAEIAALTAEGGPTPLDWRRLRRAERRVMRELAALYADRLAENATTTAPLARVA